jgi:hypothetical protein
MKGRHDKKPFKRDKNNPYTPDSAYSLMGTLDKCKWTSVNSTLMSRLKAFLSCLPFKLKISFAMFR